MPELTERNEGELDPRIARHLQPGERVLWQGGPRPSTFVSPLAVGACLAFIVGGLAEASGVIDPYVFSSDQPWGPIPRVAISLFLVAGAGVLLRSIWKGRGANWAYAITDRRLLSARGETLVRSVEPGEIRSFEFHQDIAYWRYLSSRTLSRDQGREREKRYPGFHGLEDPAGMVDTLVAWRERFTTRAGAGSAAFVERAQAPAAQDDVPDGIRRIRHDDTGMTIDVPEDWTVTVSLDWIGPLRLFGVTLLERFIRPGKERPYAEGADWNSLTVRGAPDAGLSVTILDEPLTKTFEGVRDDPWAKRFDLKLLKSTPDLEIGGLNGFSLVRQMPAGANLASFGKVAAPVATRQAWLGRGNMHVEIVGMARLDQPEIQRAVDAMIESIRMP
ncbi:hypothetical protein [Amorphus sp. 3PC139-8]|uniref:hypothetical protein n=1 Tax=Amorphus sp. 3PC139-8 TaxID=2735676 RepID=UPI00345C78BB